MRVSYNGIITAFQAEDRGSIPLTRSILKLNKLMEIKEKVFKLITKQTDKTDITTDLELTADLGMDSLDAVEFVMALEDEFQLEVPDEILDSFKTVQDVIDFVESKL